MISLQNILNSEGQEFLDNLLNKEVVVNEKLNAATLSFQKKSTSETDMNRKLTFYKGSGINKREITVADRVMTNFYSNGMTYLNNLSRIIIDKIPSNWTFVCKYFPNHQPSFINYSILPKNSLVLSCIITTGGTKMEDTDDLRPWAEMFDIAYQEPVFRGYLTQYQKDRLNEYIKNGSSKDSFARFIITLLNPNLTHSLYQNDGFESPIDGFVFKFISDDGITKPMSAKLIDPYMTNIILKNKSSKGYKDNTDVLLSDFSVFMAGQDMDSIVLRSDSRGERYLELFYRLFNRYIKYKKSQLEDFDVDTNDIVKESINTEFDVDLGKITNETTKRILKENPEYKSIFKTLLGSFKSKKPEDYKSIVMSPGIVRLFNDIIDKINLKIENREEDDGISFSSYMNMIRHKDITDLDVNSVPDNVTVDKKDHENGGSDIQPLSFADFKKKDEEEDDRKKEQKSIKSIEDMIKDLRNDMDKLKSSVSKKEEEKPAKEEDGKKDDGGEKKDSGKDEGEHDGKDSKKDGKDEASVDDHAGKDTGDDGGHSEKKDEEGTDGKDEEDDGSDEGHDEKKDDRPEDKKHIHNPLANL